MHIGIDVGGTNTDAVLLDGTTVLAETKASTSPDVTAGIVDAIAGLQQNHSFNTARIEAVMVGTTHFINAIVEANRLAPTAAIRLGLPATAALPPFVGWPIRLKKAMNAKSFLAHGGIEFDGSEISPIDREELLVIADELHREGIRSVAISSVFSPVNAEMEIEAVEILRAQLPDVQFSLSHEIGRMGLLERENATIINASLRELAKHVCKGFTDTLEAAGINAPLFLSQNDGTLMDVAYAREHPVATFASGATNSMRGATFLSGVDSCAVVDVGGTTTDVGILQGGFPREATANVNVGGVRTNFRMPDVVSVGLGGGSVVRSSRGRFEIGPDSVGYRLRERSLVFGGDTLTATDLAVAAGRADIGDRSLVAHLDRAMIEEGMAWMATTAAQVIDRMRTSPEPLPVVLVGGGSVLLPDALEGSARVIRPDHFSVANAVGAAIAQVGGEVDGIFPVAPGTRDRMLDEAKQEATDRAIQAGAIPGTVRITDVEEVPISYLPGNATKIRVKAVGDLALGVSTVQY